MATRKTTDTDRVEHPGGAGFVLNLPASLRIEPMEVVQLSRNYEARVYQHTRRNKHRFREEEAELLTGYVTTIRNRVTGRPPYRITDWWGSNGVECFDDTLLDVKMRLECWATILSSQKRTRTIVEEEYNDE